MKLTVNTNVLTRERIFPLLVQASPDFAPQWQAFYDEWKEDKEGIPYYICLGDFARYLVAKFNKGEVRDFPEVFRTVERLHIEGDAYVREAAPVGLLEGLQNILGDHAEKFVPYLLPETKRWWGKLNDFWERGTLLTDD